MQTEPLDPARILSPARVRSIAILLALIVAIFAPLWHLHVVERLMHAPHADLFLVMTGVRATLNGIDPYSDQVTREIQVAYYGRSLVTSDHAQKMAFAYPAYTAIVLAPLSLLSSDRLRLGFLVLVPIMMAATVPLWLSVLTIRMKSAHMAIATILFLASWPVMWSLRLQQPTLIVAVLLVAGCFLLKRQWDVMAGFLFALSTIKPQLVGPLLIWLLLWTIRQYRWRFIASLLSSITKSYCFPLSSSSSTPGPPTTIQAWRVAFRWHYWGGASPQPSLRSLARA
jgi:hypothetical protein